MIPAQDYLISSRPDPAYREPDAAVPPAADRRNVAGSGSTNTVWKGLGTRIDRQLLNSPPVSLLGLPHVAQNERSQPRRRRSAENDAAASRDRVVTGPIAGAAQCCRDEARRCRA